MLVGTESVTLFTMDIQACNEIYEVASGPAARLQISNTCRSAVTSLKPLSTLHRLGIVIRQFRKALIVEVVSTLVVVEVLEVPGSNSTQRTTFNFLFTRA